MVDQSYMFMWCSMLVEGNELNIEIHKKRSQGIFTRQRGSEEGPICKAKVKFDDLQKHLCCRTGTNCEGIFTSIAPYLLTEFQQNLR